MELTHSQLGQQLLKLCKDGCTAEVGVFKSLLDQGADPNIHDEYPGYFPLWCASRYGKRDLVELFLQYKADINLKTKDYFARGETVLHAACKHGHVDVASSLLQHGAVVDNKDMDGQTALHRASNSGHTDVVKLLVDCGAQIDNKDKDGWTALDLASNKHYTDVVKALLASGAHHGIEYLGQQLLKLCKDGCTAKVGVFKSLLDQGVDPNIQDDKNDSHPLWYASRYGKRDLVELFLQYKADVNLKTINFFERGKTALHAACKHGHVNVATLLLHHGAVVDSQDWDGQTALHLASSSGHTAVVKLLVNSGAQLDNTDKDGQTALHLASSSGHTDVVKLLVDSGAQIDNKDKDGWTVLDLASNNDHTDVVKVLLTSGAQHGVKYLGQQLLKLCKDCCTAEIGVFKSLLDQGVDPNIQEDGWTALDLASNNDHSDVVKVLLASGAQHGIKYLSQQLLKLCKDGCTAKVGFFQSLLDQGANPNMHDEYGYHPLWYTSLYGKRDLVELFLQYKADVNLETKGFYGGALHAACEHGHMNVASSLLQHGAVVDSQDKIGQTALRLASRSGHTDVVKLLVDSGAQIDNKDKDGWTALDLASNEHHTDVVKVLLASGAHHGMKYLSQQLLKLCKEVCAAEVGVFKSLLDQGADPNMHDEDGLCPLWYASRYGKRDLVELFLQYKADANLRTKCELMQRRETALHTACKHGYVHVTSLLLKHGAVVDSQTWYGQTALHLASSRGHADVVKLLVDSGAQIDIKDENGHTALHLASRSGHTDVVELLLVDYGAQLDNKDKGFFGGGETALHAACKLGHNDVASSLLQHGAVVDSQDQYEEETALHAACKHGAVVDSQDKYEEETALHAACKHGAVVDSQDKEGWTALHYASNSGHTDVVKLLVDSGTQIENKNKDGETALHLASSSGHTDVVKLLIDSGAQIDNKDKFGLTPLNRAKREGHSEIVSLLEKALTIEEKPLTLVPVKTKIKEKAVKVTKDVTTSALSTAAWDLPGVDVCGEMTVVLHSSAAQQITWEGFGLKLHLDEGSLPLGIDQCTLTIKASLAGQYEFPDNSYLVSAIIWLRCEPMCKFTKPVTLKMQHCARSENVANLKLKFVRAVCNQKQLPYTFNELGGDFTSHSSYGVVEVKGFCGMAITQGGSEKRKYCSQLFHFGPPSSCHIHFIVTWDVEAHLTAVKQEYANEGAIRGPCQPVYFESDTITLDIPIGGISIQGRTITPLMQPIVTKDQVDDFNAGKLTPHCELLATVSTKTVPILVHRVNLLGAKPPNNFLNIILPAFDYMLQQAIMHSQMGMYQAHYNQGYNPIHHMQPHQLRGHINPANIRAGQPTMAGGMHQMTIPLQMDTAAQSQMMQRPEMVGGAYPQYNMVAGQPPPPPHETMLTATQPQMLTLGPQPQQMSMMQQQMSPQQLRAQQQHQVNAVSVSPIPGQQQLPVSFGSGVGTGFGGQSQQLQTQQALALQQQFMAQAPSAGGSSTTAQPLGQQQQQTSRAYVGSSGQAQMPDPIPSPIRVVKPGSIKEPDRLFNQLAKEIGDKYKQVGIDLGLTFQNQQNALETGPYANAQADQRALKMLNLWREQSLDKDFTYSILATALKKNDLQRSADEYCYRDDPGSQ